MTRAAIYCRISRDREGAGLGVQRQEDDCRELAKQCGWTVAAVHTDNDLSAYSGKSRPGYRQLLEAMAAGLVDVVVAWHTDRLHRSPVELEEYIAASERHSVPTHTVKAGPLDLATPSGRLVARQLGAVARYEVEHAVERQQRAKLQAATDGRWKGGRRPYGYEADGMTVRECEAAVVDRVTDAVLAGGSLRALAADLNARGEATSTGKTWSPSELRKVLLRPRNAGLMEHRREVIGAAQWPAIVDEDRWRAVVSLLTDPSRRTQWSSARRWMLSGLATCGVCGSTVVCTQTSTRTMLTPSYACKEAKHVARNAVELDSYIGEWVIDRLSRRDAAALAVATREPNTAAMHRTADALRERLDELASAYAEGAIDGRQLRQGSEKLRARLTAAEAEIAAVTRGSVLADLPGSPDLAERWEAMAVDQRRAVIGELMTVVIHRAPRGRRPGWRPGESYFDSSSIEVTPKR